MLISVIRTLILYVFIIIAIRLMGKRQISDMQPSELVVTMVISDIAEYLTAAVERRDSRHDSRCARNHNKRCDAEKQAFSQADMR